MFLLFANMGRAALTLMMLSSLTRHYGAQLAGRDAKVAPRSLRAQLASRASSSLPSRRVRISVPWASTWTRHKFVLAVVPSCQRANVCADSPQSEDCNLMLRLRRFPYLSKQPGFVR